MPAKSIKLVTYPTIYTNRWVAILFVFGLFFSTACNKKSGSDAADLVNNPATLNGKDVIPESKIQFTDSVYNFGEVYSGDKVKHIFTFRNVGNAPLVISNASASCGCTVPSFPREVIPVGGKNQIEVVFNTEGKIGTQHKTVTVLANTNPNRTHLLIEGEVKPLSETP